MIAIVKRKSSLIPYRSLVQGDTFILPNGETVYMKLQDEPHFSNEHARQRAVSLKNGNVYDCFRGKSIVKVDCQLTATEA